jgi:hypothetical protein
VNSHELPNNGEHILLVTVQDIFGSETNSFGTNVLASFESDSAVLVLLEMVELFFLAVGTPVN